ncbi:hypothetical protein [Kitasatospora cineracea]|uniref:hypothetical protein n=1 Tax=Kitasatospora cineracea TaxID=88074 RepID=UPI00367D3808
MNITVTVDEITLTTVIGDIVEYDEDGDANVVGHKTVADLVAAQIVDRLVKDRDVWPSLRERVTQIRDEEIRTRIAPSIEAAVNKPIRKTNAYGEPTGSETTLSELIVVEAQKFLTKNVDDYNRQRGTVIGQMIAAEVKRVFEQEIAEAVKKVRETVAEQIGTTASSQITAAAMKALNS